MIFTNDSMVQGEKCEHTARIELAKVLIVRLAGRSMDTCSESRIRKLASNSVTFAFIFS